MVRRTVTDANETVTDEPPSGGRASTARGTSWPRRLVTFGAVFAILFFISYAAGVRGMFSSTDHRLGQQILDPASRVGATVTMSARIATAIAADHPIFAGASDGQACPGRYAARATSIIEAMAGDEASATLRNAGARLRDGGWRIDPVPTGARRGTVTAHNRQGLEVTVAEVAGSEASSIEVTVTVPCSIVAASVSSVRSTTTQGD